MSESQRTSVSKLIERAKQGDAACRDRLFTLCRTYLNFAARSQLESRLRRKADASDLVQETLLEAFRDFERFEGSSEKEWLVWLKRILSHNVADFARRYHGTAKRAAGREVPLRNSADSQASGVAEPAADQATPSQELMRIDDELRIAAALGELPPDYQEVIMLRNLQRLSFQETAERMERTRPAVQMLWMRAIRRLHEILEEDEETAEGEE